MNMKTVSISSVFTTQHQLVYRPIHREFQSNNWYLKILFVGVEAGRTEINDILTLSCNFITAESYSNGAIHQYEQPLQMFLVKCASNAKNAYRFNDDLWHYVNSPTSQLQFSVRKFDSHLLVNTDVKICLVFAIREF